MIQNNSFIGEKRPSSSVYNLVPDSVGPAARVESIGQLLAGLEERNVLFGDVDAVAGGRVATDAGIAALDREGAEPAQLHPVAASQCGSDLVEDRGDDRLDVALVEV